MRIDEKVYGPEHPIVAKDFNYIGLILKDKNDLDSARVYLRRALIIFEREFGTENQRTIAVDQALVEIEIAKK